MDTGLILQSALGAAIPIVVAAWKLSGRLTGIETRIGQLEGKVDGLDSKREQIALIPSILSRLETVERAVIGNRHE